MKKTFLLCGYTLIAWPAFSQLVVGNSGMTIKPGTILYSQGLVLTPSNNLTLTKDTFTVSNTPVSGTGGASIAKVFNINPAINFSGTMGISYKAAELNGNVGYLLAIAFNGGAGGMSTVPSIDSPSGYYYVYTSGLTNQSVGKVTAVNNTVSLPITLGAFSAKPGNACSIALDWIADRADKKDFNVEHSTDGRSWNRKAGTIAQSGHSFSFTDREPMNGVNLYRLDYHPDGQPGTYSYSKASSGCDDAAGISVYPNPVAADLNVKVSGTISEKSTITLYDSEGKLIRTAALEQAGAHLSASDLPAGMYLIEYRDDRKVQQVKFSKL